MSQSLPISENITTLPTLTPDKAKELAKATEDPTFRHADENSASYVLAWFCGGWYKATLEDLPAIAKIAKTTVHPERREDEDDKADD